MISLMPVNSRKAAERIRTHLLQHGIQADLQSHDPALLTAQPATPVPIHILVAEVDLARAREIVSARLAGA